MRVLLDPNVYVSFLLAPPNSRSPIVKILHAAAIFKFTLILPVEAIDEARRVVLAKRHLSARIAPDDLDALIDNLMAIAILAPRLQGDIPRIVQRDPNDDYIVAQAIATAVDVVVTGDKHLLELGQHRGVRMIDPAAFALEIVL